jgi:hypothetical protein
MLNQHQAISFLPCGQKLGKKRTFVRFPRFFALAKKLQSNSLLLVQITSSAF